jgi:hypothetical protein
MYAELTSEQIERVAEALGAFAGPRVAPWPGDSTGPADRDPLN